MSSANRRCRVCGEMRQLARDPKTMVLCCVECFADAFLRRLEESDE